jgi:hypothetical protein
LLDGVWRNRNLYVIDPEDRGAFSHRAPHSATAP